MRMDLGTETHRNENAELDKGRNRKKAPQPPEKKFNPDKYTARQTNGQH